MSNIRCLRAEFTAKHTKALSLLTMRWKMEPGSWQLPDISPSHLYRSTIAWTPTTAIYREYTVPVTPDPSDTGIYRKISNIRHALVGNKIVHHSDVVGASPVIAAPTASSFSTQHMASIDWDKGETRRETFKFWDLVHLILDIWRCILFQVYPGCYESNPYDLNID